MRRTLASLLVAATFGGLAPAAHASCPKEIALPGTDKTIHLALVC